MANAKISALTAATTPLTGTEVLPIVQSSTTKNVSVANLTAGRAIQALTLQIPLGSASAPSIFATGDSTTGIYASAAGALSIASQGYIGAEMSTSNDWRVYRRSASSQYIVTSVNASGANLLASAGSDKVNIGVGTTTYLSTSASGSGNVEIAIGNLAFNTSGKGILDANSNELVLFTATASAVNELTIANAATGNRPTISATGGDTNISINLTPKGTGDVRLTTGNLVQGTAAKGINFTANTGAAGMTSQLLNWYEEGTFTPTFDSTGGVTYTDQLGWYTRIGNLVTVTVYIRTSALTTNASDVTIGSLPFAISSSAGFYPVGSVFPERGFNSANATDGYQCIGIQGTSTIKIYGVKSGTGANTTNVIYTDLQAGDNRVRVNLTYRI
jgi:hypothetical protein